MDKYNHLLNIHAMKKFLVIVTQAFRFIKKNICFLPKKINYCIKRHQGSLIIIPIVLIIALFGIYIIKGSEKFNIDLLIALITATTFIFTMINVHISNFWSEISNHRNATLINVPYIDVVERVEVNVILKEPVEIEKVVKKSYINIGDTAVKYLKLYENDVKDKEKRYYSEFNDGVTSEKDKMKHRVKNTTKSDEVCLDAYIYSELKNKFKQKKNYSNVLIHTDFSQRNIFIIYTYYDNKKCKISHKRFTPMSYDMNYEILVGQENISKVIGKLQPENKNQEVKFINTVIDEYTNMMKY